MIISKWWVHNLCNYTSLVSDPHLACQKELIAKALRGHGRILIDCAKIDMQMTSLAFCVKFDLFKDFCNVHLHHIFVGIFSIFQLYVSRKLFPPPRHNHSLFPSALFTRRIHLTPCTRANPPASFISHCLVWVQEAWPQSLAPKETQADARKRERVLLTLVGRAWGHGKWRARQVKTGDRATTHNASTPTHRLITDLAMLHHQWRSCMAPTSVSPPFVHLWLRVQASVCVLARQCKCQGDLSVRHCLPSSRALLYPL